MTYTEDDTFRKLRQAPVKDALKLYHLYWKDHSILKIHLRTAGWTYEELCLYFNPVIKDD